MKHRNMATIVGVTSLVGGAVAYAMLSDAGVSPAGGGLTTGASRAKALAETYQRWEAQYEANGGDAARVLNLARPAGHGAARRGAWGQVELDLVHHEVRAGVVGATQPLDLWVVRNVPGPGRSAAPEAGDSMERVGTLTPGGPVARLDGALPAGGRIDLVAVTEAGRTPDQGTVLVGYANLFHRLHDRARDTGVAIYAGKPADPSLARFLGPAPATAQANPESPSLEELIEEGERLFTEETFEGNGRTCSSCHPPLNNFTLDQEFIADLPDDDPLFVAEFDPALETLEEPELMRGLALVKENQDGMDDLENKFNMRAVSHTLALQTSLDVFFLDDNSVIEAIGWSGDGAPNGVVPIDGALRLFANGAITQHATKSLDREEGVDFRLATDDELDAMEAFQLSLGRQEELDLTTMAFASPAVTEGMTLFNDHKCGFCHANAGANDIGVHPFGPDQRLAGGNLNLNTGVENIPLDESLGRRPRDGGFGAIFDQVTPLNPFFDQNADGVVDFPTAPEHNCSTVAEGSGAFGDGTFNIPPLVEAADTPPFFHNNGAATLEESVAFYGTTAFNCSPGGRAVGGIAFASADEVTKVSNFLRVLNVLENIRASDAFLGDANAEAGLAGARPKLEAALADIGDGLRVLGQTGLHRKDAAKELKSAQTYVTAAVRLSNRTARNVLLNRARASLERARAAIED